MDPLAREPLSRAASRAQPGRNVYAPYTFMASLSTAGRSVYNRRWLRYARTYNRGMPQHTAPPRQERSRQTLERLLSAAEDLFADVGEPGFTIPEVSRRAGLSVGTVYRRFANKEDLLLAVMQRVQRDDTNVITTWAEIGWEQVDARTMIGQLVRDLSRPWRDRAPLMRAVMARRLRNSDGQLLGQGLQVVTSHVDLFRATVLTHADELQHPEPDEAIEFGYRITISTCARWTAAAIETQAPTPMSWDTMLERLTDTVTAYLFGLHALRPPTGAVCPRSQS